MRRLIVNADDFGLTADVNRGIIDARREGILRSATLMANGSAFDDAVERALAEPGLDVGCHLVLVGGESAAAPGRRLPSSVGELLWTLARRRWAAWIEEEFSAQIEKILAAGLRPTHLDTHKHTHLAPTVLRAALRVGKRYSIGWIRRPFDTPIENAGIRVPFGRRALSRALRPLERRFLRMVERRGLRVTDAFWGFQITGFYDAEGLAAALSGLPEGVTELMTHPGYCEAPLLATDSRLKQSRRRELEALRSERVRLAVEGAGIKLASFAEL